MAQAVLDGVAPSLAGWIAMVHVLDIIEDGPCPRCGSTAWIVDGDGAGRYWLLCVGKDGCVETREIPANLVVEEEWRSTSPG
jgi:hypothetical protein